MLTSFTIKNYYYDVLIIGAGGSGLMSAILAAKKGYNVAVASKVHVLKSHTIAAQGGINASLGNITPDDWRWHMYDTIKASDWLADEDAVEFMCQNASDAIKMLDELGVEFDRTSSGKIDQKIYGGQSTNFGQGQFAHRACYSKDRTGSAIMEKLYQFALEKDINFYNYNFAIDLLLNKHGSISGAVFWDIEQGIINIIRANSTIIASGGYSQIYNNATSAAICTGDGNGLASRAGIALQDMEFVQFHPTAICKIGILVTEAARSAGGKLINGLGERFMAKYAPKFMELAPRDIVSRAIAMEIMSGLGAGANKDHILLDITHLSSEEIKHNLPTIYENCYNFLKLDPSKELIPISPAAHYTMGGIPVNISCQVVKYDNDKQIDVPVVGLYAIGEAASISVHGAGRLGCNSLLDLIVFAKKVIDDLVICEIDYQSSDNENTILQKFSSIINNKQLAEVGLQDNVDNLTQTLKTIMNIGAGVFRDKKSLTRALEDIWKIKQQFKIIKLSDNSLSWNMELQHYLELENMLISAEVTLHSALDRKESRGAHSRVDFPEKNDKFMAHSLCYLAKDKIKILSRPVRRVATNVDFFQYSQRNY